MYVKYIPIYIIDIYIYIYSKVFPMCSKLSQTTSSKNHLDVILHKDGKLSDVPMGCMCADVQK